MRHRIRYPVLPASMLLFLVVGCAQEESPALWGTGTLEADEVVIASVVSGRLLGRPFEEGDRIGAGAVAAWVDSAVFVEQRDLARLEFLRIAVERAQARTALGSATERLTQARRERDRLLALKSTDAVPQARLDDANTAVILAERAVESARTAMEGLDVAEQQTRLRIASLERQIRECRITAPISGIVLTTYMEPGEVAVAGRGILRIGDLSRLHVRVYLPADIVGRVRLGGEAEVRVDSWPGEVFAGRVVHIAEEAEFTPRNVQTAEARADLVFAIKVSVPDPDGRLKIGLPAEVTLPGIEAGGTP